METGKFMTKADADREIKNFETTIKESKKESDVQFAKLQLAHYKKLRKGLPDKN